MSGAPAEDEGADISGGAIPEAVARPIEERDIAAVARLERETFSSPWKPDTFRRLLERDGTEIWVLDVPHEGVVGYAVLWCVMDHGELANLAVHPTHRGRGLGSLLLDRVLARAAERGVRNLYLEVRVSNERAAALYERRGFQEIGRRRDYYERPREDARVLVKRLT